MTFTPERIAQLREQLSIPKIDPWSAAFGHMTARAALDEIERLGLHNASQTLEMDTLRAELSRLKAELDEAVGLLKPFANIAERLPAGLTNKAAYPFKVPIPFPADLRAARSFLSRMEGRKDG